MPILSAKPSTKAGQEAPVNADVMIGLLTQECSGLGVCRGGRPPFEIGVIKNRYVGRTFMRLYPGS